jgi:hypothetical protein
MCVHAGQTNPAPSTALYFWKLDDVRWVSMILLVKYGCSAKKP